MDLTRRWRWPAILMAAWASAAWAQTDPTTAPAKKDEPAFIRFTEGPKRTAKLETATVTYVNDDGVKVHLVGAVHVGDQAYYKALNAQFAKYDALLYEMIKPKGAPPPKPGDPTSSLIGGIQRGLEKILDLSYQLDGIDYHAKNFIHADLDAETFSRLQDERGESMFGLMLKQAMAEMARNPAGNDVQSWALIGALLSKDRSRNLKVILGQQIAEMPTMLGGTGGEKGTVLVEERDKAAIATLNRTIAAGKKDIGIFYGVAHLPDLEKRLAAMEFKKTETKWLTAWDIPAPKFPTTKKADGGGP